MAYTDPTVRATGYIVTAAVWNADMVNNFKAIATAGGLLKHEAGGIEADISAITTGGILRGTGAGTMAILAVGTSNQLLGESGGQVAWLTNIDIPGTLDVTGAATLDSTLAVAGVATFSADVIVANGQGVIIGHTAQVAGTFGATSELQVLGTAVGDASQIIGGWDAVSADGGFPKLMFVRSRNATIGSFTKLNDGDSVGSISWGGDDGTDYQSEVARVQVEIDGAPASNNTPGRIIFRTNEGGASTIEQGRIDSVGRWFFGDTANANAAGPSLTIKGDGTDGLLFTLKDSDVTNGFSNVLEADTFGSFQKVSNVSGGGLEIRGLSAAGAGISIAAYADATDIDDTDTSNSLGAFIVTSREDDGSNNSQNVTAGNIFVVRNGSLSRLVLKEDGELHLGNATPAALDDYDDAQLIRAFSMLGNPAGAIRTRFDEWVHYNHDDLVEAGIMGRVPEDAAEGAQGLWNVSQHIRLLNGAVWQSYTRQMAMSERIEELETRLLALGEGV